MQRNFYLSLVLIAVLSFIIISGCGGDNNGITQPSSISIPTANPAGSGYLTITVVWPDKQPASNEFILSSSEDRNDLIASAPYGTSSIVVKIYDPDDTRTLPDGITHMPLENGTYTFNWNGQPEETKVFGPIPAIEVKIVAEAWMGPGNEIPGNIGGEWLSKCEKTVQIKPGMNQGIDLDLGDTVMWAKVRTPGTGENCDAAIDVNLSIDFQPTIESSSLNALDSPAATPIPSPIPQGNRKIKFTVENVTYTGTDNVIVTPADIHVDPELTTDPNGNCTAMVKADKKPVKTMIKATLVGLDGQDTDISETCDVNIGKENYKLTMEPNSVTVNLPLQFKMIANSYPYAPPNGIATNVTARLVIENPAPDSTPKPVSDKIITFKIIKGNDENTILSLIDGTTDPITVSGTTDTDGYCITRLITSTTGVKEIEASFQAEPNNSNSIYRDKCYVTINPPPATPTPTEIPTEEPTSTPTSTPTPYKKPYLTGEWRSTRDSYTYNLAVTDEYISSEGGYLVHVSGGPPDYTPRDAYTVGNNISGLVWPSQGGVIYDSGSAYSWSGYPGPVILFWKAGLICDVWEKEGYIMPTPTVTPENKRY